MRLIEIVTEDVNMPESQYRKFKIHCPSGNSNSRKWQVIDREANSVVYNGDFDNTSLCCHNLNKKHYRDNRIG